MLEFKITDPKIDEAKTLRILYDESKKLEATDGHFTAHKIFKDEQASGVFSVYIGIKPAYMVLSELKEQLERNGDEHMLNLIASIEEDISFLEEE